MMRPKPPREMMDYVRRLQFEDSPEKRIADLDALLRSPVKSPMAPPLREFADSCPDLLQQGQGMELTAEGIYTLPGLRPTLSQLMAAHYASAMAFWSLGSSDTFAEAAPEPPTEPFETNMVEPLVGWRTWRLVKRNNAIRIASINEGIPWPVDKPFEAVCREHMSSLRHKKDIPRSTCACGIYAADSPDGVAEGNVLGTIYGWGRYVRGDKGWRSQFAYPKEFFLLSSQAMPHVIGVLRQYHVPIHVDVPTQVYDPREDGYENEYREAEAHGDRGAYQESDAQEDQDADDDA